MYKKVRDRSHAPKSATPIVAKQSPNRKGFPYYHPSGVAFLPNSYRMITKKGYNIPLAQKSPFRYSALFGEYIIARFFKNGISFLKNLANYCHYYFMWSYYLDMFYFFENTVAYSIFTIRINLL